MAYVDSVLVIEDKMEEVRIEFERGYEDDNDNPALQISVTLRSERVAMRLSHVAIKDVVRELMSMVAGRPVEITMRKVKR